MSSTTFTKTFHRTTYPAISPARPELSCAGKTIVITGAGSSSDVELTSIGATTALSFARAGAASIALLGRNLSTLEATKSLIVATYPKSTVACIETDVSSNQSVALASHTIRSTLGAWDIFVHAASVIDNPPTTLRGSDEDDWWKVFEINVRSLHHVARHFMPKMKGSATFINISASSAYGRPLDKASAYCSSKLAAARVCDFLAEENKANGLRVFNVHPGVVKTKMLQTYRGEHIDEDPDRYHEPSLAADFCVWCSSSEADFLVSRHIWANWNVEELVSRKQEFIDNPDLCHLGLVTGELEHFPAVI